MLEALQVLKNEQDRQMLSEQTLLEHQFLHFLCIQKAHNQESTQRARAEPIWLKKKKDEMKVRKKRRVFNGNLSFTEIRKSKIMHKTTYHPRIYI